MRKIAALALAMMASLVEPLAAVEGDAKTLFTGRWATAPEACDYSSTDFGRADKNVALVTFGAETAQIMSNIEGMNRICNMRSINENDDSFVYNGFCPGDSDLFQNFDYYQDKDKEMRDRALMMQARRRFSPFTIRLVAKDGAISADAPDGTKLDLSKCPPRATRSDESATVQQETITHQPDPYGALLVIESPHSVWPARFTLDGTKIVAPVGIERPYISWESTDLSSLKKDLEKAIEGKSRPKHSDHIVIIWDAVSGKRITSLRGHTEDVLGVGLSYDGKWIVSASPGDRSLRTWDVNSAEELDWIRIADEPKRVSVSPDDVFIGIGSTSQDGIILKLDSKTVLRLKGHQGVVNAVAFDRRGRVATASKDTTVRLWTANDGKSIKTLQCHNKEVNDVAFSFDGAIVASAGSDDAICLWDGSSDAPIGTLIGHDGAVLSVAFSPDDKRLVSASVDGTARLWDLRTVNTVAIMRGHTQAVGGASFSPDGSKIVTASADATLRVWSVDALLKAGVAETP